MVDLMMWLVIAALLLAAALQGISYYKQAAQLNNMKTDAAGAGSIVLSRASMTGGVDLASAQAGMQDTASSALNVKTVESAGEGRMPFIRITNPNVKNVDVIYLFENCNSDFKIGINVVPKGSTVELKECGISESPGTGGSGGTVIETTPKMVSVWDTSIAGCTTITLPVAGTINAQVTWGDGTTQALTAAARSHTYASGAGKQTVTIDGTFTDWGGSYGWTPNCVTEVTEWDKTGTTSLRNAFYNAGNLTRVAKIPAGVTNMERALFNAKKFTDGAPDWDVSNVTNMTALFDGASVFNGDISGWKTANVKTMDNMFHNAYIFNQDLGAWKTGNVTTMSSMFNYAHKFNKDISNWDTSQVTELGGMFGYAYDFNQPIGKWTTSNVKSLGNTFYAARSFNQDLSNWKTHNVTWMAGTFQGAAAFDSDISTWDTSKVTSMSGMFYSAAAFNKQLNGAGAWNTSNVTDMNNMFNEAFNFGGDISNWDTSKVKSMNSMFVLARQFKTDIRGWNVAAVTTHTNFANNSGLIAGYFPAFPS